MVDISNTYLCLASEQKLNLVSHFSLFLPTSCLLSLYLHKLKIFSHKLLLLLLYTLRVSNSMNSFFYAIRLKQNATQINAEFSSYFWLIRFVLFDHAKYS